MEILEFILRLIIIFALCRLTRIYAHRNYKMLMLLTSSLLTLAVIEAIFFIYSPLPWTIQMLFLFVIYSGVWIIIAVGDRYNKKDNDPTVLEEKEMK